MGNPVVNFVKSIDVMNGLKMGCELAFAQFVAAGIVVSVAAASDAVVKAVRGLKKTDAEIIEEKIEHDLQCED